MNKAQLAAEVTLPRPSVLGEIIDRAAEGFWTFGASSTTAPLVPLFTLPAHKQTVSNRPESS